MGFLKHLTGSANSGLAVVSNRGAYTFKKTAKGIQAAPSVSGLVSAIEPILKQVQGSWTAWGGRYGSEEEAAGLSLPLPGSSNRCMLQEVLLTPQEAKMFYEGFANSCLWPLCHSFLETCEFNEEQWQVYRKVNKKFTDVLLQTTGPQDLIWVQDFHLALVPRYVRKQRPLAHISLFWHIPFPPAEIFTVMPRAKEVIEGMLECDSIVFHTEGYVQNFLRTVQAIAGVEADCRKRTVYWSGRQVKVAAAPIGIDWREFQRIAGQKGVIEKAAKIKRDVGGKHLVIGVDRMDYTKGILERLKAIEWLLEARPEYRTEMTFVQIAVPSRTDVTAYRVLKKQIEETVGRINGRFMENFHVPVRYLFKPLEKEDLIAHYLAADMALVTPLRDGLNLVAKEYVAVKSNEPGVLVLSPFAGAAVQLKQALFANPYSPREMAARIASGLEMPDEEKRGRMAALNQVVREQDLDWWWQKIQQIWLTDTVTGKTAISDFHSLRTGGVVS